jgi:uncharacterized protein (DUF1697 family)
MKQQGQTTPSTLALARYVAFLRGVNMIGHKTIKMETVKTVFEQSGAQHVKTIGASGNVLFDTTTTNPHTLKQTIGPRLASALGRNVRVVIRTLAQVRELVNSKPFQNIPVTSRTKLLGRVCKLTTRAESLRW